MWYIHSDGTMVTIAIYYIILRTIPLAIITMIEGSSVKFLTIKRDGDSNRLQPAGQYS